MFREGNNMEFEGDPFGGAKQFESSKSKDKVHLNKEPCHRKCKNHKTSFTKNNWIL